MPSLKEVRNRIGSVNSTKQITSAMKMVSASKLRRAQDAIIKLRPYSAKLSEVLKGVCAGTDEINSAYVSTNKSGKVLIVPITSNRGLCGAFNANVIKRTNALIKDYQSHSVSVLPIGKRADDFYKKSDQYYSLPNQQQPPYTVFDNLTFEEVGKLAQQIMDAYADGLFEEVHIVYNKFKNAAVQILSTEQFLPFTVSVDDQEESASMDYIFEPNKDDILTDLIPKALKTHIFQAILDSHAAEHGARMTAMHKATDNATELLKELKLSYNKARQAAITKEILEIVGGAEALNG